MKIDYYAEPTAARFHRSLKIVRGILGCVGCIAGDTLVLTERGPLPISRMSEPMRVLSWNKQNNQFELSLSGGGYPKGKDYLYRVSTQQGEFVAAGHHQILVWPDRYQRVDTLSPGQSLPLCSDDQLLTNVEEIPISFHVDDHHSLRRYANWMGRYAASARQYGQLLLSGADIVSVHSPLQGDARGSVLSFDSSAILQKDDHQGLLKGHNHLDQFDGQTQTHGFGHQHAPRVSVEGGHKVWQFFARPLKNIQRGLQFLERIVCHRIVQLSSLFSCSFSSSMSKGTIISIEKLDRQQVYWDMQVLGTHNYVTADGAIHHNSGKSVTCLMEALMISCQQEPNSKGIRLTRGAIVRNTYEQLRTTTLNTYKQWIPETISPITKHPMIATTLRQSLPDGTSMEMEVYFLALDRDEDVRKLLSMEITWLWGNEARELVYAVIKGGRERIGRYPAEIDGYTDVWKDGELVYDAPKLRHPDGSPLLDEDDEVQYMPCTRKALLLDSNPCDDDHWWYQLAENGYLNKSENKDFDREEVARVFDFFRIPAPLIKHNDGTYSPNPKGENIKHLPGRYQYYLDMIAGNTPDHINVMVLGNYGTIQEGKPVYRRYNDALHCQEVRPINSLTLCLGWDFGLCYDDQTEVLTKDGWKFFRDVDARTDAVATRDPLTGRMSYTDINFKVDRPYEGKMLQCQTNNVNFCVTPEHRIPYTKRDYPGEVKFAEAEWVRKHSTAHLYVDLVSNWNSAKQQDSFFGMSTSIFAGFMGIYLSEGCVGKKYGRITIYQNTRDEQIQELLDKTGLLWKYSGGKSGSWRVTNTILANFLRPLGKSYEKRVPQCIRELSQEDILEFIRFFTIGDGHIRTRENGAIEHTCFTTSRVMAGDLTELAQKVGWYTSERIVDPRSSVIVEGNTTRVIQSKRVGYSITFKKRTKRAELLKDAWSEVDYDGRIYCLNVPYHTLYIRRKGRPSWNGNTPACIGGQLTETGQMRVLFELVSDDMNVRQFARDVVKPYLQQNYAGYRVGFSLADPAGNARGEGEGKSAIGILNDDYVDEFGDTPLEMGFITDEAPTNDPVQRIDAVERFMIKLVDRGEPGYVADKSCRVLRKGKLGAYHYKKIRQIGGDERFREVPDKNSASHPADAEQYLALGFVGGYVVDYSHRYREEQDDEDYEEVEDKSALGWS